MKGIVLAGGLGTRLYPITMEVNKHLLPLYDRPMFYWPLQTLIESGINQIAVVSGPPKGEQIKKSLKYFPRSVKVTLTFINQNSPRGIPDAIYKCKKFIGKDSFIVSVGDNIYGNNFKKSVASFKFGAVAHIRKVKDPERFGVAKFGKRGVIETIVEKPKKFISNWAVCAPYIFDNTALKKIENLVPSPRNELEVVDLLNIYAKEGGLKLTKSTGPWADTGTPESLLSSQLIARRLALKNPYIFEE
jgi:glucose-1-phosphate thymidylyltransferase